MKYKKILVTGGSGFLGRHLTAKLKKTGARVLAPTHGEYDLTKQARIRAMFRKLKPDAVIHCAAKVGGIGANRENPGSFFFDNLVMGAYMIEEARLFGIRKFVALGTVCSYPKFTPVPFKEEDLWNGYPEETNAPYGLAKKMMLVQSQAYRQQYGFNSVFVLPVNLYGPWDNFDLRTSHVIPALVRKFVEAVENRVERVVLWGDGSASREFLFVEDAAEALRLVLEKYDSPEPVNIGTGKEIKIRELAAKIKKLTGFAGTIEWDTSKPNGQPRRCLDTTRAKKTFGFRAATDFDAGLKKTVDWYLKWKTSKH